MLSRPDIGASGDYIDPVFVSVILFVTNANLVFIGFHIYQQHLLLPSLWVSLEIQRITNTGNHIILPRRALPHYCASLVHWLPVMRLSLSLACCKTLKSTRVTYISSA